MQVAYCANVIDSPRQARRRAKLREIVEAYPGHATGFAIDCKTPKSHISAILNGRRGIGDRLAAKFEATAEKPPGWMDEATLTDVQLRVLAAMQEAPASNVLTATHNPSRSGLSKTSDQKDRSNAHTTARPSRPIRIR